MDEITLIGITIIVITIISVISVLYAIRSAKNKGYKKQIEKLDIEKNKIVSTPIVPELSKIETYRKNEKIETMYKEWNKRLSDIRDVQIPKITDMILEADYCLSQRDYKSTLYKIAKLEMEIYKVRTNAEFLLDDIKDITTSEERSRKVITKYKKEYRELYDKFKESENDYADIAETVNLQFGAIAHKFEEYEDILDSNRYNEVDNTVNTIEDMLKHMTIVIDEMPQIVLMAENILPKKIKEVLENYEELKKQGYTLDYLNVEYNVSEANKKINDILERAKMLDMKDSLLELKVLMEYFENVFDDFEKEKVNKKEYSDTITNFQKKLSRMNKLVNEIFKKLESIKKVYNLEEEDINLLQKIREELKKLNDDYKVLIEHTQNNAFSFSKINKELENLVARLRLIEESLDQTLDTIGSMKDDESRARQQLEEVKKILRRSRKLLREYELPVIPDNYFVELQEAQGAIKELIAELNKSPINIDNLNMRVETARDLVIKLHNRSKEMVKSAAFAEMTMVYGNRYRSKYEELDKNLAYSEMLFFKGEYKKALQLSINTLNKVEPGIQNKLVEYYKK
ncbi:MAG: septation ring formation regulator EzrA [Tenericutes bacterium]|nr:septation ring formation regulator EzrA [Mycoplasmatota bacterium]